MSERLTDIHISIIPPEKWNHPESVGYWHDVVNGVMLIEVIDMPDQVAALLVACFHELPEGLLCHLAGIKEQAVTDFDMLHIKAKGNQGNIPDAPYFHEHQGATLIEQAACFVFGRVWDNYDDGIEELSERLAE